MGYIGTPVQQALTKATSQYFNGTGSQTVFTLNRAVNVPEDLEVFVNNIQQEPGVGKSYTATGTTLTFDAAPSSGTGNIYVIYRGSAEVTRRLEHDPNAALAATTGTFSGTVDVTVTATVDQLNIDSVGAFGNFDSKSTISTESFFAGSDKDFRVKTTAGNVNHFIVQATTGNVGIGGSPNAILDVQAGAGADVAKIRSGSTNGTYFWQFGRNNSNGFFELGQAQGGAVTNNLVVDTAGRVGINTNPANPLHVQGSTSGQNVFHIDNSAGTGTHGAVTNNVRVTSDSNAIWANLAIASHEFRIQPQGGNVALAVDTSGRVTMPYQPSFYVGLANSSSFSSTVIVFNTQNSQHGQHNIGGHYNLSTGLFTAPVAGRYFFHTKVIWESVPNNSSMADAFRWQINGTTNTGYSDRRGYYVNGYTGDGGYYTDTGTMLFSLAAGDSVGIYSARSYSVHGNASYTIFTGYLLG